MKVIIVQMNSLTSKIPTARYFRYFWSVFGIFRYLLYRRRYLYRYYRPRPGHLTPSSFWLIPTLQLPTVDVRNVGPLCEYKHAESQTFSKFIDNSVTVLLQTNPDFNRLLLEFIHILERSMIDLLLHDAPELLIDRIEVRAVGTTDLER